MESGENQNKILICRRVLHLLRRHCIWPREGEGGTAMFYVKTALAILYLSNLWVGALLHMAYANREDKDVGIEDDVAVVTSVLTLIFVIVSFQRFHREYDEALARLSDLAAFGVPPGFDALNATFDRYTNGIYWLLLTGICMYGTVPVVEIGKCKAYNLERNFTDVCGLFTSVHLPVDIDYTPVKQVLFLIQISSAMIGMVPAAMLSVMGFQTHLHVVLRLRHLRAMAADLVPGPRLRHSLSRFVRYHQTIIRWTEKLNDCTKIAICAHLFLTSTVIGVISHEILNLTWRTPAGPVFHVICWLISIFANSLGGQLVYDESLLLADSIYTDVNWYELDVETQKDIKLILMRAQKPITVTAGPFGEVTLQVFLMVMKGIYYMSVLPID